MQKILVIGLMLALGACSTTNQEHLTMATLWAQNAEKARALSYQAFNIAKMKLDKDLRRGSKKTRAIVVDVDETLLITALFRLREY